LDVFYQRCVRQHSLQSVPLLISLYTPARRESGVYRDPHVRPSVRHTFGFRIIIKVPLNQIFSNFHTLLCTIKYRLILITVYFTFTVPELWLFWYGLKAVLSDTSLIEDIQRPFYPSLVKVGLVVSEEMRIVEISIISNSGHI
jgi:hypothetical protein